MILQLILFWIILSAISYSLHILLLGGDTFVEPRDFWVGWYYDDKKKVLYHFMIPMFGYRSDGDE